MNLKNGSEYWKTIPETLKDRINNDYYYLQKGLKLYNTSHISTYSSPKDLVKKIGSTQLFHFKGKGVPLVFIPSHINKAYILDFSESCSLIKKLKIAGVNPYLIEWNQPKEEKCFNFEDYLNNHLKPLLEFVKEREGRKVIVAGYCMGGLFALAAAQLFPDLVDGLITLSTPWNFHTPGFLDYPLSPYYAALLNFLYKNSPSISKHLIQLIFYFLKYREINNKYIKLGKGECQPDEFAMLENWANDGLDISTTLFLECMQDLVIQNKSYLNEWRINGEIITPDKLKQKSFCAVALNDKITPISATLPLGVSLKNSVLKAVNSGHLGMIISDKHSISPSLIEWIKLNFKH